MNILLADDHVLFRDALTQFIRALRSEWNISVCSDLDSTYKLVENGKTYDIVLLDLRMPGMNGLDGLKKLRDNFPDQVVAILSGVAEEDQVKQAMKMGARAYFPKTLSGKALVQAIEATLKTGQQFVPMSDDGSSIMPSYYCDDCDKRKDCTQMMNLLTKRERETLLLVAQGLSNKEIADELNIQTATVKLHVGGICKKLEADNRTQAAIIAHKCGLVKNR